MMRKLHFLDGAFLMMESRETPMHVGSVNLFTLPPKANEQTCHHEHAEADKKYPPLLDKLAAKRKTTEQEHHQRYEQKQTAAQKNRHR